ncbi:aldo/keto reductase [Salinimicrobium tongyeongense]|uniref:Aldo/keto reductase n=1 Tax=Salinimicrobium tongyeongense TaxID=2809707 RepID=A0ABY6NRH5_9FLAO|nr:aldo/keto reductase [Salinimicrobium tongyeongense]UZH55517.1 aldo/keto reductase [Salinimicrobium tongyeongense]
MKDRNRIGLGTVQFGTCYGISNKNGQTKPQEVTEILKLASTEGIDLLDSASGYGNSEEVLGENDLSKFKVVSKFLPPADGEGIVDQFQSSLAQLRINYLYGYLAHRPIMLIEEPGQWEKLQILKEQGLVKKIGFSLNEPRELHQLLEKGFLPDLVQVPFNYFDRRFQIEMKELRSIGCEIHTRSTFLQGLFFMDPSNLDSFYDEIKPLLVILQKEKERLSSQLLKFVLDCPFVDKVILGVENTEQLSENLKKWEPTKLPEIDLNISTNILTPSSWPKKK